MIKTYSCACCDKECVEDMMDVVFDIGMVCHECLEKADNKTGYCSMACQLGFGCDGSC